MAEAGVFETDLQLVAPLTDVFSRAGHRLYLVGGVVRDRLIGAPRRASDDIDLTTDARPEIIEQLVADLASAVWAQGARFGTIGCRIQGKEYEITTHRSEAYSDHSRKPEVIFSDDLGVDLSRRDFTVNAMAVDVANAELIDPFDGRGDLAAGTLRTPVGPDISFSDDPLRMLRAARFIAGLGLEPAEDLLSAVERHRLRIEIVSVERIRDELMKLLGVRDPSTGFAFLASTGLLSLLFPELTEEVGVTGARLESLEPAAPLRLAGLVYGVAERKAFLRRLKLSTGLVHSVDRIAGGARIIGSTPEWTAPDVRRFALEVGHDLEGAATLARAVGAATQVAALRAMITELDEELVESVVPLDGREIMDLLNVEEGPVIGAAVAFLEAHRIEHGPLSADAARALLKRWSRDFDPA